MSSASIINRLSAATIHKIAAGEVIEDAAVVCASLVKGKTAPAKALKGEIRGDNFVVPLTE